MTDTFDLETTYVTLAGDGAGTAIELTEDFWPSVISGEREIDGRLVMASAMIEDTRQWEMHPAGEELLILLSGAVDVVLEGREAEGDTTLALDAGRACIVPRGRWHRIRVREPAKLVFVTYGEGSEHRPL